MIHVQLQVVQHPPSGTGDNARDDDQDQLEDQVLKMEVHYNYANIIIYLWVLQHFIQSLTTEETTKLLSELLTGRGGIPLAQALLERNPSNPDEPPHPHYVRPPWCKCEHCVIMDTDEENKCCGKRRCITTYRHFLQFVHWPTSSYNCHQSKIRYTSRSH